MSDIDSVAVDSLKVLDPKRPIREADVDLGTSSWTIGSLPNELDKSARNRYEP